MPVVCEHARVVFVLLFPAIRVCLRRRGRHRRVDRHRQDRNRVLVFQLSNQVNDLLRTTDRKRRDEHGSLSLGRILDDARERDFRIFRIVQTIAVSRFDEQVIACRRRYWIANDWLILVAQVT